MADLTCGENGSSGQAVIGRINSNTARIDALESADVLLDDRLDYIEGNYRFIQDVHGASADVGEVYETLANISTSITAGVYMVTVYILYTLNDDTRSAIFRLTRNSGSQVMTHEPKDRTDVTPISYTYVHNQTVDGAFNLTLEAKKEAGAGTFNIIECGLVVDKRA